MRTQVHGPGVHIPLHRIEPLAQLPVRQPLAVGAGLGEPGVPERVPRPVAGHARKPAGRQAQRGLPVRRAGHRPRPHRVRAARHGGACGGNPRRKQGWDPRDRCTPADTAHAVVGENLNTKAGTASAKGTGAEPGRNLKQQAGRHRNLPARGGRGPERKPDPKAGEPVTVNPVPTSQTCRRCGHVRRTRRPSQTLFVCGLGVPGQRRPPWGVIWILVRVGVFRVDPFRGAGQGLPHGQGASPWRIPATREPDGVEVPSGRYDPITNMYGGRVFRNAGGGSPKRGGNRRSQKAFQGLCGGPAAVRAGALQGAASDRSPSTILAPVAGASQATHRLHPAEDPLRPLAATQTHRVAGMARRAPVDGRVLLLRHMRCYPPRPDVLDTVLGVVAVVSPQRQGNRILIGAVPR